MLMAFILAVSAYAQDSATKSSFILLQSGEFVDSISQKPFIVVPFDGMSSQDIYKHLMENASLVVNNPTEQISGVEYSIVKVRIRQHLLTDVVMMLPLSCTGTVIYEFQVKDGRVKVNAPMVENPCHYGTSDKPCYFNSVVKGFFKKGKLKDKKAAEFNNLIYKTNYIIDVILGKASVENTDEDW